MASKMRIKFIQEGFREIVASDGVAADCHDEAERIAATANANAAGLNGEFVVVDSIKTLYGAPRACSQVIGKGYAVNAAEATDNVLSSAVM